MISEQQLIGFVSGTLAPEEGAALEAELAGDRFAQRQLAEQQLIDQALRVALGPSRAEERVKNSVLAVVRGIPPEELRDQVLIDTVARKSAARRLLRPPQYTVGGQAGGASGLIRRVALWMQMRFLSLPATAFQLFGGSPVRRCASAIAAAVIVVGLGFYLYQRNQLGIEVGKFAAVTGSPTLTHLRQRSSHHALRSTAIRLGDRIETGDADKAEIQFRDGTTLRLNFNTTLDITKTALKPSSASTLQRPAKVALLAGQVWSKVQKLTNAPRFAVETPVATATVKGTEFGLKLQKATTATLKTQNSKLKTPLTAILTVREGAVEFSNVLGSVEATALTESQATADSAPTQPQRVAALKTLRLNRTHLSVMNPKLVLQNAPEYLVYPVGWIGATLVNAAAGPATAAPPPPQTPAGVRILSVEPGSPAALAGLQVDDVISAVNGETVTNTWQVRATTIVSWNRPLTLNLQHAGGERTATVIPTSPLNATPLPAVPLQAQKALFGATAQLITAGFHRQVATGQISEGEIALEQLLRSYPDVAAIHHNLAFLYESKDELGQAIREYQQAVRLDPYAALYRLNLGLALRSIGNLDRSLEELEEAARRAPSWPLTSYWLADAYSVVERREDAVNAIDAGLRLNPNDPTLWQQKAEVLLRARQAQAALPVALKAVELGPSMVDAHITLGNIYDDLGRKDEAEVAQRKALELAPPNESACINLAHLLRSRGRLDEAEALYRKAAALEPNDAEPCHGLGGVFFDRRQAAEAEKWFRKAVELDPDSSMYCASLGNILRVLGKLNEGEQLLRKAIELEPENAEAHVNLGLLRAQRGQLAEAEQLLLRAIELNPSLPVEGFLAMIYRDQGKVDQEEEALRRWLARNTSDPQVCNELAWNLARRSIKLDEALTLATHAAESMPTNTNFLDTLGWVYYQRGELDEAEASLKKAVDLAGQGPTSSSIKEHLKKVYEKKGQAK